MTDQIHTGRETLTVEQRESEPDVSASDERPGVLFHTTSRHNLPAICEQGVRPIGGEHRSHLADELAVTASENGLEYPIDRQECVFFYPELTEAVRSMRTAADARAAGLGGDVEGIVVVDIERIENELFIGDFSIFSDIIDFQFMDSPDSAMVTESYEDAIHQYIETLTPVKRDENVHDLCERAQLPEVLVEGGVNPDAIIEVQSLKRINGLSGTREPHESLSLFEGGRQA